MGVASKAGDWAFKAFTAGLGVATTYLAATFSVNVYRGLSWHNAQSPAKPGTPISKFILRLSEQRRKKLQAKEAELRREQDVFMYFRGSGKAAEMKREAAKRTMMAALP